MTLQPIADDVTIARHCDTITWIMISNLLYNDFIHSIIHSWSCKKCHLIDLTHDCIISNIEFSKQYDTMEYYGFLFRSSQKKLDALLGTWNWRRQCLWECPWVPWLEYWHSLDHCRPSWEGNLSPWKCHEISGAILAFSMLFRKH